MLLENDWSLLSRVSQGRMKGVWRHWTAEPVVAANGARTDGWDLGSFCGMAFI